VNKLQSKAFIPLAVSPKGIIRFLSSKQGGAQPAPDNTFQTDSTTPRHKSPLNKANHTFQVGNKLGKGRHC